MRSFGRKSHLKTALVPIDCPICAARMMLRSETPLSEFGSLGITKHRLECPTCAMQIDRAYHPSVGYQNISH